VSKASVVYNRDYQVGHNYDGLRRALETDYESLGKHELVVADYHPISADGALFRLHLKENCLSKLKPPITDGWILEPAPGSARARVLSVDEDEDRIYVRCNPGGSTPTFARKIRVTEPDYRKHLREWLSGCGGRPLPRLLEKLQQMPVKVLEHSQIGLPEQSLDSLRDAQVVALAKTSSGLTYLWGPPGTGKTYTLARTVASLVAREYKVLVVAPTNVAVDNILLAIHRSYLAMGSELPGGFLLRAGYPDLEELQNYPVLLAWQETLKYHQQSVMLLERQVKALQKKIATASGVERESFLTEQAELKGQRDDAKAEWGQALWKLAQDARVLTTTVYSALQQREILAFLSAPKVALVVDEAGMVARFSTLPLLEILGGGEGLQEGTLIEVPEQVSVIYGGDPKQLSPIHRQKNPSDVNLRYWLGESLMEELLRPTPQSDSRTLLDEQSRMDSSICRRISRTYYEDKLKTLADPHRPQPPLVKGWPEDGLVLVDPRKLPLPEECPGEAFLERSSTFNEWRIWYALGLIREVLRTDEQRSVLWLTPFRAQAGLARSLRDTYFSTNNVRVGTVHASQGTEADFVLFDPVNIKHLWLRGSMGSELDIERMLNVAISRARGQAIVFGTPQELAKNDIFRRLLHDATVWVPG